MPEKLSGTKQGRFAPSSVQAKPERTALNSSAIGLIWIESLQWCANNAVYFLGLIGAATYDLGGSAFLVAAVTLTRNLTMSAGNVLSGPAIDRYGPRRVAVAVCAVSAVIALALGLLPVSLPAVIFAAIFLGLMGGFINTTTHAYPGYLVRKKEDLQRLNGLLVFCSNIAFTIGPIVGGMLVSHFASNSVYLFMAPLMGACAVIALFCRETYLPSKEERSSVSVAASLKDGAQSTFVNPLVRVIFFAGFLGFFAFGAFDSLESLYYRDVLTVDIAWMGWLSAVSGVALSITAYAVTKLPVRIINLGLLLLTLLVAGIGSVIYVCTDMLAFAIAGQFITGLAFGVLEPVQMILVQEVTPIAELGRVTGFVRFGHMMAGVAPLLVAPFLASVFGPQPVLIAAASMVAIVGGAFCLRWLKVWSALPAYRGSTS